MAAANRGSSQRYLDVLVPHELRQREIGHRGWIFAGRRRLLAERLS
jgi:hypothetical protein